jgi:ubiquinone/menaquinone biosynthesis C-methylase UbiE
VIQASLETRAYIIRGGVDGRERLRILARVMQPTTLALLDRGGIRPGMACLDVGCGGGDVSLDLARLTGPGGRVIGIDKDEVVIEIARREAGERGIANVDFLRADITEREPGPDFDLVYARFLLTHLRNPAETVARLAHALRPGGILLVEDVDFRGHFCYPHSPAFDRYVELYTETVRRRGGDPNIGPRLPALLVEAGLEEIEMNVVQPAGTSGEVKLITPITMERIAEAVLTEGLASRHEIAQLVSELYEFAHTPGTVAGVARVVQAWGCRPKQV